MFQTHRSYAAILLGALAVQSVGLVHGLPTVTNSLGLSPRQETEIPGALSKFPPNLISQFLAKMSSLPEGEAALDAVGKLLTPLQQALAKAANVETKRNDLAKNAPCADLTVVFARGTTEPGNVGLVTGPPFFDALKEQLGDKSLAVQGVEYPATFAGFNKNGTEGVASMTKFVNQALTNCPATKVVMSGYSQGALVVRSTADTLPADTLAQINSMVTFGDPRNSTPITGGEGKTLIVCDPEDTVCSGGFINIAHLTYADYANSTAEWVIQQANL